MRTTRSSSHLLSPSLQVFADPDFSRGAGKQILNKAGLSEQEFYAKLDDKDMLASRPFFETQK